MKQVFLWISFLVSAVPAMAAGEDACVATLPKLREMSKVSIVLAGENLRSPVSMFGHTFLVFHNEEFPEPDAITFEFIGVTTGDSWFALRALAGFLPGRYRLGCFQYKQAEYEQESRDLWSYQIKLDDQQRMRLDGLVDSSLAEQPDYGFSRTNCAARIYHVVLESLPAPVPFELVHVPIKGLRHLKDVGALEDGGRSAASALRELRHGFSKLSRSERSEFRALKGGASPIHSTPAVKSVLSKYVNYQYRREPVAQRRTELFRLKQQVEAGSDEVPLRDPLLGVGKNQVRLGFMAKENTWLLGFSPGVETIWNRDSDSMSFSELEFLGFELFRSKQKFGLSRFTLFSLDALSVGDEFDGSFVSKFEIAYRDYEVWSGRETKQASMKFGAGYGMKLFSRAAFSLMPVISGGYFSKDVGGGMRGELGARIRLAVSAPYGFGFQVSHEWLPTEAAGFRNLTVGDLILYSKSDFSVGATAYWFDFQRLRVAGSIAYRF